MTRATEAPLRRIVRDRRGREYVAEIRADTVSLRPLRTRCGGPGDVSIGWGAVYVRGCLAQPNPARRRVRRGILA